MYLHGDFVTVTPHMIHFLESLGLWQISGSIFGPLGHHQYDQEAQEHPQNGDLVEFICLDGNFVTLTPHMIPF